jgi:hypothetical protein
MKRIVYQAEDGSAAIITPAADCGLTIYQIALKDVPAGVPYKIVDTGTLPTDRTFRAAWEVEISTPDGIGADYGVGSRNEVADYDDEGNPIIKEAA